MNNLRRLLAICALVSGLEVPAMAVTGSVQSDSQTLTSARRDEQLSIGVGRGEPQTQNSDANKVAEANELLQTGVELYRQGKFDEALVNAGKASGLSPNDHRPQLLAGLVYMSQMKLRSASEAFGNASRLRPQAKELYILKADVDARRGANDEAIAASRKALEIDPNYAEAYGMIGKALRWDDKRRPEAIAAFRSAIKINPRFLPPYEQLGQILDEAKDQKAAEEVFRQGVAADPKQMIGRFALGRMLVKQGRLVEAREIWEGRTSDEDHTFPQFIELLKRAENLKRATDALAQKPKDPDALIEMGLAVMEGDSWVYDGRQKRAIVYFKEALTLKPNYARAQYAICKAYIQIADTFKDEKITLDQELTKLRQLDPALAQELEEYRKKYVGGIVAGPPVKVDQ